MRAVFILFAALFCQSVGLYSQALYDPQSLGAGHQNLNQDQILELEYRIQAEHSRLIPDNSREIEAKVEEAERAFLSRDFDRAWLILREAQRDLDQRFLFHQQLELDHRLQELSWLVWTVNRGEREIPASAYRYGHEDAFVSRLPSRAQAEIKRQSATSLRLPKEVVEGASMIWLNFSPLPDKPKLVTGSHLLHLLTASELQVLQLELQPGLQEPRLKTVKSYSLWQSPKLETWAKQRRILNSTDQSLRLLRKNIRGELENILLQNQRSLPVSTQPRVPQRMADTQSSEILEAFRRESDSAFEAKQDAENLKFLKSPWFWLGVGLVAGGASFAAYQMTQSRVVRTP
ncbi:MAG: hypothetical protein EA369_07805 [Bradymonadales bacterium]|nr:MAG: hypothetical protein EA369_07805 [Bradymonadales bacterium]